MLSDLRLLEIGLDVAEGRLCVGTATGSTDTVLADLTGDDPGPALYRALFEDPVLEQELLALDRDAETLGDSVPRRLRLCCADPEAAVLPWHCLSHPDGTRLGERGWVIDVTGPAPAAPAFLSLLAPLVLAPADPDLAPEVGFHVDQVLAHLAPLTVNPALPPRWAVGSLDLDEQLRDTPELIYCYARLDSGGGLLLGASPNAAEAIAPADLLSLLVRCDPASALWLHWIEDDAALGETRLRELVQAFFEPAARRLPMLLVQRTTEDALGASLNDCTLELLHGLLAPGDPETEPAALFSRLGDPRGLCLLGQGGLVLVRPVDEDAWLRASIHAGLLRLLLGRAAPKAVLRDRLSDPAAHSLLLYAVCGDRQARVHDFPDQARWHLRDNRELRVRHRPIPCRMRPDDDADSLRTLLHEALQLNPRRDSARTLLTRMEHPPVPRETVVISLHWLAEPGDGFEPDHLDTWLRHWKRAVLGVFGARAIPDQYRILCGPCLQWPDPTDAAPRGWPDHQGQSDQDIQDRMRDCIERGNPAHAEYLLIERPLGRLRPAELERFFVDESERLGAYTRGLPAPLLADWVHGETRGRFRDSVETIYRACKQHFDQVERGPTGTQ